MKSLNTKKKKKTMHKSYYLVKIKIKFIKYSDGSMSN